MLDLANNKLELIPADVGWLPLSDLKLEGNARLRIPRIVQEKGFKWVGWGGVAAAAVGGSGYKSVE